MPVSNLPEDKLREIQAAFTRLGKAGYRVITKWEEDSMPNQPDNVLALKWLPLQDILGTCFYTIQAKKN